MDRYLKSMSNVKIKSMTKEQIDYFFFVPIYRLVKNDSTISIKNTLYEVDPSLIGKNVKFGFPIDNPENIYLYENDKPTKLIKKVDVILNANNPSFSIHFKDFNKEEK